jgi:hypothetical protein
MIKIYPRMAADHGISLECPTSDPKRGCNALSHAAACNERAVLCGAVPVELLLK